MTTVKTNFAPVVAIVKSQASSKKRWRKIRLTISWNYKLITAEVTLTRTEWKKIIEGVRFGKAGGGFMGEDGPHQDFWRFNYKGPASLEVEYAQCTRAGLDAIADHLRTLNPEQVDVLRGKLCIGIHRDVEVTDAAGKHRPLVSQAFCSALPVNYNRSVPSPHWEAFGSLVLQAAYEATMLAGVLNARRGGSKVVLLTELGGGAFGNDPAWIHAAMRRALDMMSGFDLDAKLVSRRSPSRGILQMAKDFG